MRDEGAPGYGIAQARVTVIGRKPGQEPNVAVKDLKWDHDSKGMNPEVTREPIGSPFKALKEYSALADPAPPRYSSSR